MEHIFAIGDCTSVDVMFHDSHWANPELTPVAVQVRAFVVVLWSLKSILLPPAHLSFLCFFHSMVIRCYHHPGSSCSALGSPHFMERSIITGGGTFGEPPLREGDGADGLLARVYRRLHTGESRYPHPYPCPHLARVCLFGRYRHGK